MARDRIRAKPPTTDVERWRSGTVESVRRVDGEVVVAVVVEGDAVDVRVTEAIYDLFSGRLDADDPVGETVWIR